MSGLKYDEGKNRWDLIPLSAVSEIAKVLTFGANKYGSNNWQKVDNFDARYFAALMRHMTAWRAGEDIDKESGLTHLAHAGCCLLFLLSKNVGFERDLEESETDKEEDRPIPFWPYATSVGGVR